MKYFLILWLIVFSVLCLFAAHPSPPAGYAYETDLRPHSLVLTNAAAAGLAKQSDITSATNALKSTAIFTPDGQTWTDATGCVWQAEMMDCWILTHWRSTDVNIRLEGGGGYWAGGNIGWMGGPIRLEYYEKYNVWVISDGPIVFDVQGTSTDTYLESRPDKNGEYFTAVRMDCPIATNLVTRVAYTNDLANLTTTIPTIVTNVVRDVQGLVYDEKLGITWRQVMHDGNLYYVAITNANITEVK